MTDFPPLPPYSNPFYPHPLSVMHNHVTVQKHLLISKLFFLFEQFDVDKVSKILFSLFSLPQLLCDRQ